MRHRRLNRGLPPDLFALREHLTLTIDVRAREAFEHFGFRSSEMATELDVFRGLAARCGCFVDVGAHYGLFTLVFLHDQPKGTAIAVEPSEAARKILRAHLKANGVDHATVVEAALGAQIGTMEARVNEHHLEVPGDSVGNDRNVRVSVSTLDHVCSKAVIVPDLVKIDVEGFELDVLQGGRKTLARYRPTLMIEIHPYLLKRRGKAASDVAGFLERLGYRPQGLTGSDLTWLAVAGVEEVARIVCRAPPPGSAVS